MASRVWKDGTRRGIAYVEGRDVAEKVASAAGRPFVATTARNATALEAQEALLGGAMAVYSDRRGRPFAWQIPFDIAHWEQVTAVVPAIAE